MKKYDGYYTCPFCFRNYRGYVPSGGDGSLVIFPNHSRNIPYITVIASNNRKPKKERCPGSLQSVDEK